MNGNGFDYFSNKKNLYGGSGGGGGKLPVYPTAPTDAVQGQIYYNSTDDKIYYYDGSDWQEVGSGSISPDGKTIILNGLGELQANSIIDIETLPTTDILENTLYRVKETQKWYNGEKLTTTYIQYKINPTGNLVLNGSVLTDNTDSENPVNYNLPSDTATATEITSKISTWISNGDLTEEDGEISFINSSIYDLTSNINIVDIYNLFFRKGNEWREVNNQAIDDIILKKNTTRADVGLVGTRDIRVNNNFLNVRAITIDLNNGETPNPDIIQDGDAYKYASNKTSSNNYINTQIENVKSMAEGSNKTYFINYPNTLPSAGNRSLNSYYFVQLDSASSTNYKRWFIDSVDTAHDLGTTQLDVSTLVAKDHIATSFNATSTNDYVGGAKAIYDNFAPISSVFDYGTNDNAKEPGDAVFSMKSLPNGVEVQQRMFRNVYITDPVVGGNCWGRLEVVERNVRNSTVSIWQTLTVTSNVIINNQVVVQNKVFKRNGLYYGSGDTVYDNRSTIDWKSWYPVEYPVLAITLNQEVVGSNSRADLAISGGVATIRFNNLNFKSSIGQTATMFDSDTRLSILRINKYQFSNTAGSYVWNVLISTDPTKTILVCCNPQFYAWGAIANVGYYGLITIPLGY